MHHNHNSCITKLLSISLIFNIAFAKDQSIPTYKYDELEKFTEKFDEEPLDDGGRLLGVGGYGKVFFGKF